MNENLSNLAHILRRAALRCMKIADSACAPPFIKCCDGPARTERDTGRTALCRP